MKLLNWWKQLICRHEYKVHKISILNGLWYDVSAQNVRRTLCSKCGKLLSNEIVASYPPKKSILPRPDERGYEGY